ncbi:unnamed protein product [Knipowitschia caucasica]
MNAPSIRQICLLCLLWCFCCSTDASSYRDWEDGLQFRSVRDLQDQDVSGVLWRDSNEEQVQNVFKRFLFQYSKARNSVGSLPPENHSVHPLMRLSPKLAQRRKKKVVLLIRALPEDIL